MADTDGDQVTQAWADTMSASGSSADAMEMTPQDSTDSNGTAGAAGVAGQGIAAGAGPSNTQTSQLRLQATFEIMEEPFLRANQIFPNDHMISYRTARSRGSGDVEDSFLVTHLGGHFGIRLDAVEHNLIETVDIPDDEARIWHGFATPSWEDMSPVGREMVKRFAVECLQEAFKSLRWHVLYGRGRMLYEPNVMYEGDGF